MGTRLGNSGASLFIAGHCYILRGRSDKITNVRVALHNGHNSSIQGLQVSRIYVDYEGRGVCILYDGISFCGPSHKGPSQYPPMGHMERGCLNPANPGIVMSLYACSSVIQSRSSNILFKYRNKEASQTYTVTWKE